MNSYISFIYDGILNTDRIQQMIIITGNTEEAGKYVKKNVAEFFDYFYIMAHNVRNTPDNQINELELAAKKAFWKHNYLTNRGADRKIIISELKHMISEINDVDIMPNFNSCNRELMSDPNDRTPYKIIETHRFIKSLGGESIEYRIPNKFGV